MDQTTAVMEIPSLSALPAEDTASAMANVLSSLQLSLLQIVVCSNHLPHDGKYLTTKDKHKTLLKTVDFVPSKPLPDEQAAAVEQAIRYGALVGEGTVNARIWANEQSSELNPRSLELLCRRICERDNVEFKVLQVDLRSEGEA